MALPSTLFKFRLNVSDTDRHVYDDFALSVARHPSETNSRMMLRVAAFAFNADAMLEFGRGISTDDEPDLWQKDLTGAILHWIDLGTPDPERLRKACGRADAVTLFAYGERAFRVWWEKHSAQLARFKNLSVFLVDDASFDHLGVLAETERDMQCTLTDGELYLTTETTTLTLKPTAYELRR